MSMENGPLDIKYLKDIFVRISRLEKAGNKKPCFFICFRLKYGRKKTK